MAGKAKGRRRLPGNAANVSPSVGLSTNGLRSNILCRLAETRIREGKALLKQGHYTGAAYISGYAIEFYLKAMLASQQSAGFWPLVIPDKYKTHNLSFLLKECGLLSVMKAASSKNFELGANWKVLENWGTELRYRDLNKTLAIDIFNAVADEPDGVAKWLRFRLAMGGT